MPRISALLLALAALAPLSQLGCTPEPDPNEPATELQVTATAAPAQVSVAGEGTLAATVTGTTEALTYLWQQVDGPAVTLATADQPTTTFVAPSFSADKVLRFQVIAQTADATARGTVSVTVLADPNYGPGNQRPVANAGADRTVLPGDEVTLDGTASTGLELQYRWRQVSGTSVVLAPENAATAEFTAPVLAPGGTNTLVFELTVTDAQDRSMTDRVQIKVRDPNLSDTQVRMKTSKGDIIIELNPEKAPITVANFLQYVDDGFYDGTIFHRVIPDFVIQGGGFEPGLEQKETRDPIKNEADNGLSNVRGTISMARTNDPDSATSQFFINVKDNIEDGDGKSDLDPGGVSPDGYTVFGEVVQGMDVVDEIVSVETTTTGGFQDVPVEDILIESVERVQKSEEI